MIDINRMLFADDILNSIVDIARFLKIKPVVLLALLQPLANFEKSHARACRDPIFGRVS